MDSNEMSSHEWNRKIRLAMELEEMRHGCSAEWFNLKAQLEPTEEEKTWRLQYSTYLKNRGVKDHVIVAEHAEYDPTRSPQECAEEEMSYWYP